MYEQMHFIHLLKLLFKEETNLLIYVLKWQKL